MKRKKLYGIIAFAGMIIGGCLMPMKAMAVGTADVIPRVGAPTAVAERTLSQKIIRRNGQVVEQDIYIYDGAGRLVQEIMTDGILSGITAPGMDFGIYGNDVSLPNTTTSYIYDDAGRLTAKYVEGVSLHTTRYSYDGEGNLVKEASHYTSDFSDAPWSWTDYSYDENGNLIRKSEWMSGALRAQYDYSYDAQGRVQTEVLTPGGGFDYVICMFEDERIANDYSAYQRVYSYDTQGRIAGSIDYDRNGNVSGEAVYTYTGSGSNVQRVVTSGQRRQEAYCEYDLYGNVTKVTAKVVNTGSVVTETFENIYVGEERTKPQETVTGVSDKDAAALAVAQSIAASIPAGSDLERVRAAAAAVEGYCANAVYTSSDPDYRTAYGVFCKGVYTCAGATRALGMVLDCMGYNWTHANENSWTHQWCELTMDGQVGWADGMGGIADYGTCPFASGGTYTAPDGRTYFVP